MAYDCTADVKEHIGKVQYWMRGITHLLTERSKNHDASKFLSPEKAIFDVYTPKLKEMVFGSDEYKEALAGMGEGLKHHYANNRHHPEHFERGINGMTLPDLVEMYCDWLAAAEAKHTPMNMDYLCKRFGIGEQLAQIILNTLKDDDFWNAINGVPVTWFTPEKERASPFPAPIE